jgi:predicted nucleotidyltransferase
MASIEKNELFELEILKHVEETPRLNNRMAASKLGCSVKLAHALLSKMVDKGLLHVTKHHARRWDYFLTPRGIAEKARITYEFIDFSMQFYHEARRESSRVCRDIAESGKKTVSFLGDGELAEIAYLGVKEWGLELDQVYGEEKQEFLGHKVLPFNLVDSSSSDTLIVCLYDKTKPMRPDYLPNGLVKNDKMIWVFSGEYYDQQGVKRKETGGAGDIKGILSSLLSQEDDMKICFLYGSSAKERATPSSDIDVAVASTGLIGHERLSELAGKISKELRREIDIVDLHVVHGEFLRQIISKGIPVFIKDKNIYAKLINRMLLNQEDMMPNYNMILSKRREAFING